MNTQPQHLIRVASGRWLDIQGIRYGIKTHGPFEGFPAVFVDMAGCCLACTWCNVDYTSNAHQMSVPDIADAISNIAQRGIKLAVISGGEPCRQNITPLIRTVLQDVRAIKHVLVETSGVTRPQEALDFRDGYDLDRRRVTFVVSPKTAHVDPWFRQRADHWLYVGSVGDIHPVDGLPYKRTQRQAVVIARTPTEREQSDLDSPALMLPPGSSKGVVWLRPLEDANGNATEDNVRAVVASCAKRGHHLALPPQATALDVLSAAQK